MPDSSYLDIPYMRGSAHPNLRTGADLTTSPVLPPVRKKRQSFIRFYWLRLRWLWKHRDEVNNRAKWRRMEKELARHDER